MCETAAKFHKRAKVSKTHTVLTMEELRQNPKLEERSGFCRLHPDEPFRYFDNDCKRLICRDCHALDHTQHECVSLPVAAAMCRKKLKKLSDGTNEMAKKLEAMIKCISEICIEFDEARGKAEKKLYEVMDKVNIQDHQMIT